MDAVLEFIELYQTQIAVIGGAIVVLLLAWLTYRALRHRRDQRVVERPTGRIRRPVYLDVDLLDDLRAHGAREAEVPTSVTTGATTATTSGSPTSAGSARTEETRRLNDTLAALDGSPILTDLDADPDADLEEGTAVVLTGTLVRHPASDAAEILELSAPLLQRASSNGHGDGGTATVSRVRPDEVTTETAPLVVRLDHPSAKRGYLMVLPREHLRVDDPIRAGGSVSILAVVEKVLGRRDTVTVEDYLSPHLSPQGRAMLDDRDLAETVSALSDVTNEDLAARDLHVRGPGALLTPASIHR